MSIPYRSSVIGSLLLLASAGSAAAFAQTDAPPSPFPPDTEIVTGVPRWDESEGVWRCRIKCDGVANLELVLGWRFLRTFGPVSLPTRWQPDGGEIVCNPFQTFDIGRWERPRRDVPSSCQVALD